MDGVTILESTVCREMPLVMALLLTVAAMGALLFGGAKFCKFIREQSLETANSSKEKLGVGEWGGPIVAVVFWLALLVYAVVGTWTFYNTTYTVQTVTLDESVSVDEFSERYEIISKDGDLYTVRLIEETDNSNNG